MLVIWVIILTAVPPLPLMPLASNMAEATPCPLAMSLLESVYKPLVVPPICRAGIAKLPIAVPEPSWSRPVGLDTPMPTFPKIPVFECRLVVEASPETCRLVVVASVPVARVKIRSEMVLFMPMRFVKVPFVEKKFVVVASLPVAFTKVKF